MNLSSTLGLIGSARRRHRVGFKETLDQYLNKLRGKQIVQRIGATRRYEVMPSGLRAIAGLVVLREKPSNRCSRPLRTSTPLAEDKTHDPSIATTRIREPP